MNKEEREILEIFRSLNNKGKEQALIQLRMIADYPEFTKRYRKEGNIFIITK